MKIRSLTNVNGKDCKLEKGHFNGGEHLFVDIAKDTNQTISCLLPNGKFVTFAFIPGQGDEIECVDIHSTVGRKFQYKPTDSKHDIHFQQQAIGFSRNGDTFDTREVEKPTGLITLLLGKSHHTVYPLPVA